MGTIQTVTEQVYQAMCRKILNGEYQPGTRLTLKVLMEDIGVSSSPIREALTRLQQDGLIIYQPNVGMRVREYSKEDIANMFTLMSDFDALALKYAITLDTLPELIRELRKNVTVSRAFLEAGAAEWMDTSDKFHTILLSYADNVFLVEAEDRLRMHLTIFSNQYETVHENNVQIQEEHERIVKLLEEGNYDEAIEEIKEHVLASGRKALAGR